MERWVLIEFDCLPLRSLGRLDIPIDASPVYRAFCERLKSAYEKHGSHNSYYLHRARCVFHLTNDPQIGLLEFRFEGVVLTDDDDLRATHADLDVQLQGETCGWLTEPVVRWFHETVSHAVLVEFNRFIKAGDLEQTRQRIEKLEAASEEKGGFLGMYL
ncbi:MAG: hypothetical protein EA424_28025 [Planctomycetaceae bacterium]|nr:MAG: hypothetical protein EA424_28025 [Planctomycetaceae bacterium]